MILNQISLPESVLVESYTHLKPLAELKSGIYRIVMPAGVEGTLMKLTTGEMEGLRTTSIISEGKIVGHAGLEEVKVDKNATDLLLRLSNYGMLSAHVNEISNNVKSLLKTLQSNQQAELNNIFAMFRDISLKMPTFLEDASYSSMALQSLSHLKHDAGKHFQIFQSELIQEYFDINWDAPINFLQSKLISIREHSAVKMFEILIAIEIYEILISGKENQGYINIVRQSLEERSKGIIDCVMRLKELIKSQIDRQVIDREQYQMTYSEHQKHQESELKSYSMLENEFQASLECLSKPEKIFNNSLVADGSKDILFKVTSGNLVV